MKTVLSKIAVGAFALFTIFGSAFAAEPTEAQNALFTERITALKNGNAEGVISTYHSEANVQDSGLMQLIQARLNSIQIDAIDFKITEVIHDGNPALLRVQELVRGNQEGERFDKSREYIYMLKDENGQPKILQEMPSLSGKSFDKETGSYMSKRGGFALQIPEGWVAARAPEPMSSLIIDGVSAISPDLGGYMFVGVVQLPMNLPGGEAAKLAAQTDAASMKALSTTYEIIIEGPIEKEGMKGWSIISEFELYGEKFKRAQMYYQNDSLVYFVIGDLSRIDTMTNELEIRMAFSDTMDSFRLVSIDDNLSVAEQIRSDLGQGTITGSIYTNDDFGCYIAAPEGWSLRTSSSPNTLVEMQYDGGKSIIRLLAEDNVPSTISTEQAFRGRLGQVKTMVQNFEELPAKKIQMAGTEAWLSEQRYTLEGLGNFTVKETTMIRDGKYYLILCQAISPDDYTELVVDFDKTFASFGFTQ